MLKFHPPYFGFEESIMDKLPNEEVIDYVESISGLDLRGEFKKKKYYHYKSNKILLQPWSPRGSSEARLIVSLDTIRRNDFTKYDTLEWDDKFYAFRFMRSYSFIDAYPHSKYADQAELLYDNCYDCYIEVTILLDYLSRDGKCSFEKNWRKVYDLTKLINKSINHDLIKHRSAKCMVHGYMDKRAKNNYYYGKTENSYIRYSQGKPPMGNIRDNEYIIRDGMKPLSKRDNLHKNIKDMVFK